MAFSRLRSFIKSSNSSTMMNKTIIDQGTIQRLCDHLQSTSHIQDREETIRILQTFSKNCECEAGNRSVFLLAKILEGNKNDSDLIQLILETLTYIITCHVGRDEESSNLPHDNIVQFSESFTENNQNVDLVLDFVGKNNFNVRRAAIEFLLALPQNSTEILQNIILKKEPVFFRKLFDILKEKREFLRNDGLLLFQILTRSSLKLQDIFVRQFGFDRLFKIFDNEPNNENNITTERCFSLLINLLENNPSHQRLFYQSGRVHQLALFIRIGSVDEECWSEQKVTNVRLLLQIIRTITRLPNCYDNSVLVWQRTFREFGILHRLCLMLKLTIIPVNVLSENIITIGDIIRGDVENQKLVGVVGNQYGIIQPSLFFNLFKSMTIDSTQTFELRISVLFFLQCYLFKNNHGKSMIIQTFLSKIDTNLDQQHCLGDLLIIGFISKDVVGSWSSAIALSHLIADNQEYKEILLKILFRIDQDQIHAKSLMEISFDLLKNSSSSFQTRIGVLILLCTWIENCSTAVYALISIENSISYFISQIRNESIGNDREILIQSLCSFALGLCLVFNKNQSSSQTFIEEIINCLGFELFEEKFKMIEKSNIFKTSTNKHELSSEDDMVLDNQFISLYNYYYGTIIDKLSKHR